MDVTSILEKAKPGYVFQNMKEGQLYNVGFNDAGMTGIKAVGTHELVTIPAGKAVVGGCLIMKEALDSGTDAATVKIQIDGEDLTPAKDVSGLPAGTVIAFDLDAGKGAYAVADITVDAVVAVEAVTAGRMLLLLELVDVEAATTRG